MQSTFLLEFVCVHVSVGVSNKFFSDRIWKHQFIFAPFICCSALGKALQALTQAVPAAVWISASSVAAPAGANSSQSQPGPDTHTQGPRNSLKSVGLYTNTATCMQKHMLHFEIIFFQLKKIQTKPESTHQYLVAENYCTPS